MPAPILVVDDDPDIQTVLRMVLQEEGYPVTLASNGAEALTRLQEQLPALMLLDLNMPVMSGWELYAALDRQTAHFPILIMTAGASAQSEAARLGADGFLPKPFDMEALLRAVAGFAGTALRYERLTGIASLLYYVYAGDQYVGVISEVSEGRWQAVKPDQQLLGVEFSSREQAGRILAAQARDRPSP